MPTNVDPKNLKPRRVPIRSCVVCRQTSEKRSLIRVVRLAENEGSQVVVDRTGKRSGRGAYICPESACIDVAAKQKRFERALSMPMGSIGSQVFDELKGLVLERRLVEPV